MTPTFKYIGLATLLLLLLSASAFVAPPKTVHDFTVKDIVGNDVSLSKYKGKTLLIVNVASKCGLTPQYEDLQKIYADYHEFGLEILGFPANNFMGQEPGSDDEINTFCTDKFGVTFPMFSKISVKGKQIHPLYGYLTDKKENKKINAPVKWNFQKFLVDKEGKIVKSFTPNERVTNTTILAQIEAELTKGKDGKKIKEAIAAAKKSRAATSAE